MKQADRRRRSAPGRHGKICSVSRRHRIATHSSTRSTEFMATSSCAKLLTSCTSQLGWRGGQRRRRRAVARLATPGESTDLLRSSFEGIGERERDAGDRGLDAADDAEQENAASVSLPRDISLARAACEAARAGTMNSFRSTHLTCTVAVRRDAIGSSRRTKVAKQIRASRQPS